MLIKTLRAIKENSGGFMLERKVAGFFSSKVSKDNAEKKN